MVPGGAPGSKSREGDLTTSSAEQRTRTFDVAPASRSGMAGPSPGDVLKNRFVLHQCLADGATSRLFRALDRRLEAAGEPDPWVVLKVVTVPPEEANGDRESRALQALRREAAIAQGLDHPNLPRIVGIDHEGPHTFVCMSWIEGESLAAILDSRGTRPMTRVQAMHIVEGVGRALIHLHAQGITHADVKPGNILVTAQGDPTLLGFGVALGPGAGDLSAVRGYTPEYASPDVLVGNDPTASDDLFSLACVAYRMLGGRRAFGTATAREAAAGGSRPPRLPHLSPAQWRALDRGLSFGRSQRQPDVATFLAQLKGGRDERDAITDLAVPEAETPAPSSPIAAPAALVVRTWPRLAAGALVVILAGAGLGLWQTRSPEPVPQRRSEPRPTPVPAPLASASLPVPAPEPLPAPEPVSPQAPEQVAAETGTAPPPRRPGTTARVPPAPARVAVVENAPAVSPPELAGPPVPDSVEAPPPPAAVPTAAAPASALPDTNGSVPTVPFSSLTVRRYVEADYPRAAASERLAGWVDVAFMVDPSGRTQDVRVVAAEPAGAFDDAAITAVRRWRFASEGRVATGPVASKIRVRFNPE